RPNAVLFDRDAARIEISLGAKEAPFQTEGYESLAACEDQMEAQEDVRLLYVAATRARDHLVVSLYRTNGDKKTAAAEIARILQERDDIWEAAPTPAPFGFVHGGANGQS